MNLKIKMLILTVAALVLMHCAGTQKNVKIDEPRPTDAQTPPDWNEDFDPLSLNDYTIDIKPRKAESRDVVTVEQLLKGGVAEDAVSAGQELQGFRVQLISTRDQEAARSVMRNAVISFSENVYREYDNPYYKIRVGDFKSRYNANLLQEKAIEMGFHEAWVVRTIIRNNQKSSQASEDAGKF